MSLTMKRWRDTGGFDEDLVAHVQQRQQQIAPLKEHLPSIQ